MKVIKPSFEILTVIDAEKMLGNIERAGRTCYKSSSPFNYDSAKRFVRSLIDSKHESVLEHESISVRIICDRGVSHELVRHRIASYSQESTRFCNYAKSTELVFIKPCFWEVTSPTYSLWESLCCDAESCYLDLIDMGATPQEARSVLPNSLKTEIVITQNLRQWRHFFKLRALGISGKPHPQMLEITVPLLSVMKMYLPVVFDDLLTAGIPLSEKA